MLSRNFLTKIDNKIKLNQSLGYPEIFCGLEDFFRNMLIDEYFRTNNQREVYMKVFQKFFVVLLSLSALLIFSSPLYSSYRNGQVTITIEREGQGSVILNGDDIITEFPTDRVFAVGDTVSFFGIPDPGWKFVSWKVYNLDGTSTDNVQEEIELAVEEITRVEGKFYPQNLPPPADTPTPADGAADVTPGGLFGWINETLIQPIVYRFRIWTGGRDGESRSYFEAVTPVNSFSWSDILNDPQWNTIPYWKTFEWQVIPTTDPTDPSADAIFCPIWTFTTIAAIPPTGLDIILDGVSLYVSHNGTALLPFDPDPIMPPTQPDLTLAKLFAFSVTCAEDIDIIIQTDTMFGWYYQDGNWYGPILNTDGSLLYAISFGRSEVILYGGNDQTLPVELTSFTATLTTDRSIQLQWISETETNLLGYHIYRNTQELLSESVAITPVIIPAANTSATTVYFFEDLEVQFGFTYYYWLEYLQIDLTHGFFGPVSAKLTEDTIEPPEFYLAKLIINYPNPFNPSTMIKYRVEENTPSLNLKIYNIRGQEIHSLVDAPQLKGDHTVLWNGRDKDGQECATGIYFCRLATPSSTRVHKMMLLR